MVANIVKVISIISLYLLCNSISFVHSGPGFKVNDDNSKELPVTTIRSQTDPIKPSNVDPVKDVEPSDPPEPTVNPTISPPTQPPSPLTSSTMLPSTTTPKTNVTTTVAPPPASSSISPTAAPAPPVPTPSSTPSPSGGKDRHFDGPSFIGGIVLAAGLACIGFVGFKVYRARTERNYHTL